ncbi:ABC transporter permease [Amycolatopsis suaedae]|uniref:ABC transporter permease n=1 Tax=Amycolatopsis suaedae TaxID=2510978 RepID=A0A4Q7J1D4_9PSEU|nr:ABC transporter permease [Amycolatopsis suaedae]RZQ60538.1 ABC transporter permease [Amycolatopsis suaedae]
MWASTVAELAKMARRPANWLLLGIGLALALTFTYLLPLAGASGSGSAAPNTDRPLEEIMPAALVGNSVGGLPVFLGAIALVVGVLAVGSEYSWNSWKTLLTQGRSRMTVYAGKLAALAVAMLVLVLAVFAMGALASWLVAVSSDGPIIWPGVAELGRGVAAGWLIAMTWAAMGAVLAIALRGVALPLGLGLVWMLVVQNLLLGIAAPLVGWIGDLQRGLPGANAGSLVRALGASPATPGVADVAGPLQAALVVAGYLVLFAGVGGWLLRRRDVL